MKRLLITGASGFLGRSILQSALSTSRYEIHAVSRGDGGHSPIGARWHKADLTEPGKGREIIRAIAPDFVIHSAWIATPGQYLTSPLNLTWLQASVEMATAFGEGGGLRWVGIGSCFEYGPNTKPCEEDSSLVASMSIYGRSKIAASQALFAAAAVYGFSAVWARVFLPYGPGDNCLRLIPALVDALTHGREFPMSSGSQIRDFIYSGDVGRMVIGLLDSSVSGAFNVGTGHGSSVRSVVEKVADYLERRHLVRFGAREPAAGETGYLVADMRKTLKILDGFEPSRIEDMLGGVVDQHCALLKDRT